MLEKTSKEIPRHIAFIMDGNGRWAQKRGLPRNMGHRQGAKTLEKICDYCEKIGVEYVTAYAFSTENWKRPPEEVDAIMRLLKEYLQNAKKHAERNIRLRFIGDFSVLDKEFTDLIDEVQSGSEKNTGMTVCIALNYGGRLEITHAAKAIAKKVQQNVLSPEEIDEQTIQEHLGTKGMPDPDLILRPSGEMRISNFLLWQLAYAELVFMDVLWPDFSAEDLDRAIAQYRQRDRRFGGI